MAKLHGVILYMTMYTLAALFWILIVCSRLPRKFFVLSFYRSNVAVVEPGLVQKLIIYLKKFVY